MGKMVEEDLEGTGWATGKMQCIEVHYDRKSEIRVPSHLLPHFSIVWPHGTDAYPRSRSTGFGGGLPPGRRGHSGVTL